MDNYVPTDDDATECTSITSALTSSTREDLGKLFNKPVITMISYIAKTCLLSCQHWPVALEKI